MFIIYHIFHGWSIHYRRKMDKKYFSVSIEEVDKDKWEEHFKKYEGNLYEKPNY